MPGLSRRTKAALGVVGSLALAAPAFLLLRRGRGETPFSQVSVRETRLAASLDEPDRPAEEVDPAEAERPASELYESAPPEGPGGPGPETSAARTAPPPGSPEPGAGQASAGAAGAGAPARGAGAPDADPARARGVSPAGGAVGAGRPGAPRAVQARAAVASRPGRDDGALQGMRSSGPKRSGAPADPKSQPGWGYSDVADAAPGPASPAGTPGALRGAGTVPGVGQAQVVEEALGILRRGQQLGQAAVATMARMRRNEDAAIEKAMDPAAHPFQPPPYNTAMARGKVWPVVGRISQLFGGVSWNIYASRVWHGVYYAHFHNGLDIAVPRGTPIRAYDGGQVTYVGAQAANGMHVILAHPGGLSTTYCHMEIGRLSPVVRPGQYVSAGQTLGYVGMTGMTTGPHLHFVVRDAKDYLDPLSVLPRK